MDTEKYYNTLPLWRKKIVDFFQRKIVEQIIIAVIVINAITLGLETSKTVMANYGEIIFWLDKIALTIFVIEISFRILGHGLHFFRDPWSIFDFIVVAIALVPTSDQFSVLRSLRILRVLRLLTIVPQMRKVVSALLAAVPGLSSIILVLLLIYYVFAVMATNLFGAAFPEWFGTIGDSMYSLFQIMTLESWSMGIVRPIMEEYPMAWMFFVPYILIATFTMLNLFIAIIVNAMQLQNEQETEVTVAAVKENTQRVDVNISQKLDEMHEEMKELRGLIHKVSQNK